jgi:hypothetical protein
MHECESIHTEFNVEIFSQQECVNILTQIEDDDHGP